MAMEETKELVGREVRAANGAYLGKVVRTTPGHIVVERGFFFPLDFAIPLEEIASSAVDTLHLRSTAAEYHERFQGAPPEGPGPQRAYPFTEAQLTEGGPMLDAQGREIYPGIGVPVSPNESTGERQEPQLGDYPLPDDDGRTA